MVTARPAKKNVTIEIRLPDGAKTAFMAKCTSDGVTASDALRSYIDAQVRPSATSVRHRTSMRLGVAAILGVAIGAGVAGPSLAHPLPPSEASFQALDRNHDGVLTYAEYRHR